MIVKSFVVFDCTAEYYLQPFFSHNRGTAIRLLQSIMSDPNHQFSKHSNEFILYEIGSFEDKSGEFIPSPLDRVGTLLELVAS